MQELDPFYQIIDLVQALGWALVPLAAAGALHSVSQYYTTRADQVDIETEVFKSNAGMK